jgi:hypothetical protein
MKRKIIIIVLSVIILAGTGTGLGLYFWLNPLGGANETLQSGTTLSSGSLEELDTSHWGQGTVRIVQLEGDDLQVQFVNVEIANGPDLYIYLSNKSTFTGPFDAAGDIIDLGLLPFNKGRFSVNIPGSEDISEVKSVLIWCLQFTVVFTYATLS